MSDDKPDDRLSDVLGHISRPQLADHPLTRAYLEAGIRLLDEEFAAKRADSGRPTPRTFLRMSRSRVVNEVSRRLHRQGGPGSLRDRWHYFSDYLGDLIRYALRTYRSRVRKDLAAQTAEAIDGDQLSPIVHEVAYRDLEQLTGDTAMRFKTLVTAFADRDPVVAEALAQSYREHTNAWRAVYAAFFNDRGLKRREGLSLDDITVILTAVAEGLTLRALGDRATSVLDRERRRSLLGTAALALVIASVDPGDGLTLDEAADAIAAPRTGATLN